MKSNLKLRVVEFDEKSREDDKNKKVRKMVEFLLNTWKLPLPEQVISVTGAADESFHSGESNRDLIKKNLKALLFKKEKVTWVITGGSDGGVMKLVGEVIFEEIQDKKKSKEENLKRKIILIGIGTFEKAAISKFIKKELVNSLKFSKHLKGFK